MALPRDRIRRSIAKALSWRFIATIITSTIVYCFTHKADFAMSVGLIDTTIKLAVYFFHERIWEIIPFGRPKEPEYEI